VSIKIMSWVWDNSPYDGKQLLLHLALADFANDAGECWPSQSTLAKKARCTERYVRDTVSQMTDDGYIEVVHVSTGMDTNRYKLVARNSVPPRKSTTGRGEKESRGGGNPLPKNRQEPSKNPKCPYCRKQYNPSKAHACSAMNMLMR